MKNEIRNAPTHLRETAACTEILFVGVNRILPDCQELISVVRNH